MNTLEIKTDSHGIAVITIDLKDRSMNVVSPEFMNEFDQAIDQVIEDENIRGAVVASGKSAFIAGADLLQLVDEIVPGADPRDAYARWSFLQQLYRKLETLVMDRGPKPDAPKPNATPTPGRTPKQPKPKPADEDAEFNDE